MPSFCAGAEGLDYIRSLWWKTRTTVDLMVWMHNRGVKIRTGTIVLLCVFYGQSAGASYAQFKLDSPEIKAAIAITLFIMLSSASAIGATIGLKAKLGYRALQAAATLVVVVPYYAMVIYAHEPAFTLHPELPIGPDAMRRYLLWTLGGLLLVPLGLLVGYLAHRYRYRSLIFVVGSWLVVIAIPFLVAAMMMIGRLITQRF